MTFKKTMTVELEIDDVVMGEVAEYLQADPEDIDNYQIVSALNEMIEMQTHVQNATIKDLLEPDALVKCVMYDVASCQWQDID